MKTSSNTQTDQRSPDWGGDTAHLPAVMSRNEKKVRSGFWKKLQKVMSHIPFAEDAIAAFYCAMDTQTPIRVRGLLLGALAYFIMPIDMIPDFIVGLGFTDDATVLATVLALVVNHIKPWHREHAAQTIKKMQKSG